MNNNDAANESVEDILNNLNKAIETYTVNSQKFREETIPKLELISKKVEEIMKSKEQIDTNENTIQQLDSSDKEDAAQINKLQDENNRLKYRIKKAIDDINNLNDADNGSNKVITGFINNISDKLGLNTNTTKGGYMYSERGRRKKNTSYKSSARGVLSNNGIENSIELYKTKVRKTKGHKSKGHKQKSRKLKAAGMLNVMRMKQTKYKKTKSKGKKKSKAKKSKSKQNKSKKNKSVKRR